MDHAEALVRAFIHPERRKRLLTLLDARGSFDIHHISRDLDPRYAHRIAPRQQDADAIYNHLRSKGAPATCFDLVEGEMDLREALSRVGEGRRFRPYPLASSQADVGGNVPGVSGRCLPDDKQYPTKRAVEYVHAPVVVEPTTHEEMYVVRDEDGNMTSVVKAAYGDEDARLGPR